MSYYIKFKMALSWLLMELEGQLGVQNDPEVMSFRMNGLTSAKNDFDKVRGRNVMLYAVLIVEFTTACTQKGEHLLCHIISNLKWLYLGS